MNRLIIAIAMIATLAVNARADAVGYSDVSDCKAESDLLMAEHHHDWSESTRTVRWKMISTSKDLFTAENTYANLIVKEKNSRRQLFKVPTPALSALWISPDSRFIVGISNIKLWNPVQLVIFDLNGALLLAKKVDQTSFSGVLESVSNWVRWYKEPMPRISVKAQGASYELRIEGNDGVDRVFEFQDIKQKADQRPNQTVHPTTL